MRHMQTTMTEPDRIKKLFHYKGIPVTATTDIKPDGTPDFKRVDDKKVWEFKRDKKCAICGDPLDYWIAFMVTEDEAKSREIFESPQHEECLRYAFELCPWLYYSKAKYSELQGAEAVNMSHPDRYAMSQRPPKLGIYICRSYENKIINPPAGTVNYGVKYRIAFASPPKRIDWIEGK